MSQNPGTPPIPASKPDDRERYYFDLAVRNRVANSGSTGIPWDSLDTAHAIQDPNLLFSRGDSAPAFPDLIADPALAGLRGTDGPQQGEDVLANPLYWVM